jgi:hypothetical protein
MPTLERQIAAKFLAALTAAKVLDGEKIDQLRVLLASGKKLKTDELVKLFAEPSGGDVK